MAGEYEGNSICPLCGGRTRPGVANVPFAFADAVIVVKNVPAEICVNCHEPYMESGVAKRVTAIVRQVRACAAEVSVVTYTEDDATETVEEQPARLAA